MEMGERENLRHENEKGPKRLRFDPFSVLAVRQAVAGTRP
jgi:hypothetical protein